MEISLMDEKPYRAHVTQGIQSNEYNGHDQQPLLIDCCQTTYKQLRVHCSYLPRS